MAEEIHNAAVVLPRALMLTVLINGILGFGMLIAVLFCMGNIEDAVNSPTGYPFIEIFFQATGSITGTVLMTTILLIIAMFGIMGILAGASRQVWSFARDRAVPGWRLWIKVRTSKDDIFEPLYLTSRIGRFLHRNTCVFDSSYIHDCLASMPYQHWIRGCPPGHYVHGRLSDISIVSDSGLSASLSSLQRRYFQTQR
jgi:hypothetical protein